MIFTPVTNLLLYALGEWYKPQASKTITSRACQAYSAVVGRGGQRNNWFPHLGKTIKTELLCKKNVPLDGQTSLAKLSLQLANFLSVWSLLKPPIKYCRLGALLTALVISFRDWGIHLTRNDIAWFQTVKDQVHQSVNYGISNYWST